MSYGLIAAKIPACPQGADATDSRGTTWNAAVNEKQVQQCSSVEPALTGEKVGGYSVNRNSRVFKKMVAKFKDFMRDSDNVEPMPIVLDNIIVTKSTRGPGAVP